MSDEFKGFLELTHTADSISELCGHELIRKSLEEKVQFSINNIETLSKKIRDKEQTEQQNCQDTNSVRSLKTNKSSICFSSSSRRSIMKTSKAAAAKVRLKFIEQEEKLKHELAILQCKREIDEAEAEVSAIQEIVDGDTGSQKISISDTSKQEIVQKFLDRETEEGNLKDQGEKVPSCDDKYVSCEKDTSPFREHLKRDLLLNSLTALDDRPETFISWKMKFKRLIEEIGANVTEELDHLTRWLGPTSKQQASNLQIANFHDEHEAKRKIWQRLEERYGAPELITESIRIRIEKFPKVRVEDCDKLFE